MSKASIWGIYPDGTGECWKEFKNSFLYAPAMAKILAHKYHQGSGTFLGLWKKVSEAVKESQIDSICWELANSAIFLVKEKDAVAEHILHFAQQSENSVWKEMAEEIRNIPEKYLFFTFQGIDVSGIVEEWLMCGEEKRSIFDLKEDVTDFIILSSDRRIPNTAFRKKKEPKAKISKEEKEARVQEKRSKQKKAPDGNIFFSSDFHFNHDKDFVWKSRGYSSVQEMNEDILQKCRERVTEKDDLYILGDVCFGKDKEANRKLVEQIPGRVHIIRGNHDSDEKMAMYASCGNVVEVCDGKFLNAGGHHFFLSHVPSIGSSLGYLNKPHILSKGLFSLYGHTHQEDDTFYGFPCTYHVGVDSHGMYPVSLEEVWKAIEKSIHAFKQDNAVLDKELEEHIKR